jgi:hypothetical protein
LDLNEFYPNPDGPMILLKIFRQIKTCCRDCKDGLRLYCIFLDQG